MTILAAAPPHSAHYCQLRPSMAHSWAQYDSATIKSPIVHAKHSSNPLDDKSPTDPSIMHHDSMVTVRLSEPSPLSVKTTLGPDSIPPPGRSLLAPEANGRDYIPRDVIAERLEETEEDEDATTIAPDDIGIRSLEDNVPTALTTNVEIDAVLDKSKQGKAVDYPSEEESDAEEVNWEKLQKTEDEQSHDPESDNSTAMLLARLEQENNKLATNPKSVKVQSPTRESTRRPRPPSIAQLRQMVQGPAPQALRYSMLPPPPMTDLEFYAALVKDHDQTIAKLPTLVASKIRGGVPPPLRGVVWQSMSRARDAGLEDLYDRLCGETSPFEISIGKDLGRTFTGVDMFRDPNGDGQRMLGRVLKCFSLYDPKIGYCQGLSFVVGPLLMHMPDRQAFCVLVRLMENYDTRNTYVHGMPGLHLRVYQFGELLKQHLPILSNHLRDLRVEPIYVSQWFLSFFAVTCPLPMLFRIYDVVFAEGASETIMRVALSLMRKNQTRILACNEFDDVLQLLLSRGLWDCYHYNADEFVEDFVELSNVVTGEKLTALEQRYNKQSELGSGPAPAANATQLPSNVQTAASRFLGRLWTSAGASSKAPAASHNNPSPITATPPAIATATIATTQIKANINTLSPRPLSMLQRSASKQSLASTLNSMEASSASVLSSASTDATSISRDSSNTDDSSTVDAPTAPGSKPNASSTATPKPTASSSVPSGPNGNHLETKYLNSQIEDLLTALSELQRTHALAEAELQQEREDREADKKTIKSLLGSLRAGSVAVDGDALNEGPDVDSPAGQLNQILSLVEQRFGLEHTPGMEANRTSVGPTHTKSQLKEDLQRTKERLAEEEARGAEGKRRILDLQTDISTLKDQLKESRDHARVLHADKQRLERQIHTMRARASAASHANDSQSTSGDANNRLSTMTLAASGSGLREFKLGRSRSTPSQGPQINKRTSSMPRGADNAANTGSVTATSASAPANEHEALLLELVQAKTSEAIAKQEAEEAKAKLEQLRRQFGLSSFGDGTNSTGSTASIAASNAASAAMGVFGRLTGTTGALEASKSSASVQPSPSKPSTPLNTGGGNGGGGGGGGGFWGWRR